MQFGQMFLFDCGLVPD